MRVLKKRFVAAEKRGGEAISGVYKPAEGRWEWQKQFDKANRPKGANKTASGGSRSSCIRILECLIWVMATIHFAAQILIIVCENSLLPSQDVVLPQKQITQKSSNF